MRSGKNTPFRSRSVAVHAQDGPRLLLVHLVLLLELLVLQRVVQLGHRSDGTERRPVLVVLRPVMSLPMRGAG